MATAIAERGLDEREADVVEREPERLRLALDPAESLIGQQAIVLPCLALAFLPQQRNHIAQADQRARELFRFRAHACTP